MLGIKNLKLKTKHFDKECANLLLFSNFILFIRYEVTFIGNRFPISVFVYK